MCLHIKRQRHIGFIVPLLALPFIIDSKSRADALYVRLTPNDFSLKPLETPKCLQAGAWGFCAGFYIFSVTLSLVSARASDASLCLYSFRLSFCLSLSSALIFASLALTLSISSGFSAESTDSVPERQRIRRMPGRYRRTLHPLSILITAFSTGNITRMT